MSQASELLENLAAEASNGAEIPVDGNIIVGADRFLTVPESIKKLGVQYDHDVNTVTFDCPRFWDGRDLATMKIYINYMRSDGTLGMSLCENVRLDKEDTEIIHFDWVISGHVTEVSGNISFLICAKKVDISTGLEENHWNSELCNEMYVSVGLKCKETVLKKYPDIITQLLLKMENTLENVDLWKIETKNELKQYVDSVKTGVDEVAVAVNKALESVQRSVGVAAEHAQAAQNYARDAINAVRLAENAASSAVEAKNSAQTLVDGLYNSLASNTVEYDNIGLSEAIMMWCKDFVTGEAGIYTIIVGCADGLFSVIAHVVRAGSRWAGYARKLDTSGETYSFYVEGSNHSAVRMDGTGGGSGEGSGGSSGSSGSDPNSVSVEGVEF